MEGFPPEPPAGPPQAEPPPADSAGFGPPPPPPPPFEPPFRPIPWEEPGKPFLPAIMETIQLFVTNPAEGYRRTPTYSELFRPLLFAMILGWLGVLMSTFYEIVFSATIWRFLPGYEDTRSVLTETTFQIIAAMMGPVFILFGIFIGSAITHILLMMLGGARGGFSGTVRVQCYSMTPSIANALPMVGSFLAAVWSIVLQIIGLSEMHRISRGKAALAVLLPIGLCCTCVLIVIMVAGIGALTTLMGKH